MRRHDRMMRGWVAATASGMALLLAGCGMGMVDLSTAATGSGSGSSTATVASAPMGIVHGGQQAVSGAHVYLFAVGATGYTSANVSLLTGPGVATDSVGGYVLTNAAGSFTITGDYTCPSTPNTPVYLLAMGGNTGGATANGQSAMMTALGSCDTLLANAATTFVFVNEITTVASAYALAGFAQTTGQPAGFGFSTSATNLAGLQNAFAMVPNVASTRYGAPLLTTLAGNGLVPTAEINTLADVIQSCINSSGGVAGDHSHCGDLFTATTVNSVAPTNTVQALINIAQNPSQNVGTLYTQIPTVGAAYEPTLSGAPGDWTMAVNYTGGGISTPQAVAVDAGGNVWVASANNSVAKLAAGSGSFVSGSTGYTSGSLDGPDALAIDTNGTVWIANCGATCSGSSNASSLTKYVPSGSNVTASNITGDGLSATFSVAVDGTNNIWAANVLTSSLTLINSSGTLQSGTNGFTSTNLVNPIWLATDASGYMWAVSPGQNAVVETNTSGAVQAGSYTGSTLNYPSAVAIDHSGRAWVASQGSNSVAVINAGTPVGTPYSGAGLSLPNAITLDGAGSAWLSNSGSTISELSSAGSALSTSGFTATGLTYANSVAVDPSGNVWVGNCGSYCSGSGTDTGSVFQFLGAGSPTATPLASAAANNQLATKP